VAEEHVLINPTQLWLFRCFRLRLPRCHGSAERCARPPAPRSQAALLSPAWRSSSGAACEQGMGHSLCWGPGSKAALPLPGKWIISVVRSSAPQHTNRKLPETWNSSMKLHRLPLQVTPRARMVRQSTCFRTTRAAEMGKWNTNSAGRA